jgi:hypothetical protein
MHSPALRHVVHDGLVAGFLDREQLAMAEPEILQVDHASAEILEPVVPSAFLGDLE